MATIDLRATQKSYKPKTVVDNSDKRIEEMEIRMKSITQTLNLILQKLDSGNDNGNNISSISKQRTK